MQRPGTFHDIPLTLRGCTLWRAVAGINPQFWPALYALLDTKQFLSDWRGRSELLHQLQSHLSVLHASNAVGAGPDERMHGGLAPFQTLVMPIPIETQLAVTHHRARKDIDMAAALPLDPPLRWAGVAAGSSLRNGQRALTHSVVGTRGARLRLGLISPDFGDHPVGHALLPWVRALTRVPRLDVLCFASDSRERSHVGTEVRWRWPTPRELMY